jgi:hypothetical protein
MEFATQPMLVRAVITRGALPGGVCSTPAEISRTFPNVPIPGANSFEHPVVPSNTLGTTPIVPKRPINSSTLLTADLL